MRIYAINSQYNNRVYNTTAFKGAKEEILSEGFKEFVSEALPIYKAGRAVQKLANDDPKGALKQTVGVVDNIVCQCGCCKRSVNWKCTGARRCCDWGCSRIYRYFMGLG